MSPKALRVLPRISISAPDKVDGAFARAGSHGRVEREVSVEEPGDQPGVRTRRRREADLCGQRLVGDPDERRRAFHDKILPSADDVGRQTVPEEADRIIATVNLQPLADLRHRQRLVVGEKHTVVAGFHPDAITHEVMTEIALRMALLDSAVFLRPNHDLPQVAVIPHVLARAFQTAVRDPDVPGVGLHAPFVAFLFGSEHRDRRARQAIGLDAFEAEVFRATPRRGGDEDAAGVHVGLPRVVGLRLVEHMADEVAAPPGQVANILSLENHRPGPVAHPFRQSERHPLGDNC